MKPETMKVLLTGATGGIGCELATRLAAGGAKLLLAARNADRLARLAERLRGDGAVVDWVAADIATGEGRKALADAAAEFEGGINVVINNAGINRFGRFGNQASRDIEAMLVANTLAPVLLVHELLPVLQAADEAQVVNVGSILGSIGLPGQVTYSCSKFALHGFTEALRRELAGTSIRVVYTAPRSTDTAMNDSAQRDFNEATGTTTDSAARVADWIVAAMETGRRERFIGWPERLFVKINALFPGLVDRATRKQADLLAPATSDPDILITHGAHQ